ncbi:MAG: hypothetical protein ACJA2S_005823 [Cyclobacteriaceae bacterium]|jgi:hypothetical protein
MKKILTIAIVFIVACSALQASSTRILRTDTLIIELDNKSKLIIYVDSQEDLKDIEDFDLNEMIREINRSIDSSGNVGVVEITDDTGERFLKDSVAAVEKIIEPVKEVEPEVQVVEPVEEPIQKTPQILSIDNLTVKDTINATLPNGDQVRLTFFKDAESEPKKKWNQDYRTSRLSRNYFAVDFGLNNWMQDGELPSGEGTLYTVKPVGSWYVGGRYFRRIAVGGPVFIDFGGSATWYTWKFENKNVRILKNPDNVEFVEDTEITGLKSKLSASYLNIEIVPVFDFSYGKVRTKGLESRRRRYTKHVRSNGFTIGIGGYAGYRLDSWIRNVYKDANGDEQKDKEGSTFHLSNLRYGARVQIGLDYDFSVFCNYDLNTVFVEDKGPKLNAVSFGLTLEL